MHAKTDYHPHDRSVSEAVRELAGIDKELRSLASGTDTRDIVSYIPQLVPWSEKSEPVEAPLRALWNLLHQPTFTDLLPFVLEKFNTKAGYTELPNRGRLRNADRQVFDTYYTPLDLARWLASETTKRVCIGIRRLLLSETPETAEGALSGGANVGSGQVRVALHASICCTV